MATKPKDNSSSSSSSNSSMRNSKKLGTVSSNSQLPTYKQPISPKPNPTSPKPTSVSSSKSVPNYLKPTFSSRSESLKLGNSKKSLINNSEDASKEKLLRRRSFDRPPPASRGSKSLISPDRKERLGSRDKPSPLATRASSFSGSRTQISGSKLAAVKSFKPLKSLAAAEINVNRSSSFSRTKNPTTKDASRSLKPHNVEIKQDKVEEPLILQDVEEVKTPKDERKEEENGDKELHLDNIDLDVKDDEEDDLSNPKEISTIITLEEENFLQQTHVEDFGSEIEFHQGDLEEEELHPICSEYNNNDDVPELEPVLEPEPEEGIVVKNILIDDAKVESDNEAEEEEKNSKENAGLSEEIVEEKNERSEIEIKAKEGEEHEVEIGVAEEIELEKEEEEEEEEEEEKVKEEHEEEKEGKKVESSDNSNEVQKSSTQGGQENNKKETPTAYNDVIEETKNKLLEKRKNKVKALVGAFETVIDYETAGSK